MGPFVYLKTVPEVLSPCPETHYSAAPIMVTGTDEGKIQFIGQPRAVKCSPSMTKIFPQDPEGKMEFLAVSFPRLVYPVEDLCEAGDQGQPCHQLEKVRGIQGRRDIKMRNPMYLHGMERTQ